jgi:hypothetical protein
LVGLTRAIYWKRKYKGKQEQAPWYLLTNLPDCEAAVKTSGKRFGIEAMFNTELQPNVESRAESY